MPDNIPGRVRRRFPRWVVALAAASTIPIVWFLVAAVDTEAMDLVVDAVVERPLGLVVVVAAFAGAFVLRSVAWVRVLPGLSFGQAWSALSVALAGNHVLPLRLGEPLRVVSVVRRTAVGWVEATASTVTLRAADLVAIALLGVLAGIGVMTAPVAVAVVAVVGTGVVVGGIVWLRRLAREGRARVPGPAVVAATAVAWALEAVVIHQVAAWAGVDLSATEAMAVTAAAVVAQVAAFAPGGLGTYEAGGVAALVVLGVDPATGLAITLSAHAIKTAYSLLAGAVGLVVPAPTMFGHLRLGRTAPLPPGPAATDPARPVVLFLPAHDEEAAVGAVVRRVPDEVAGHPVVCVVVDDGSTDDTAAVAAAAGAAVVTHPTNRGLGAAVRTGLAEALDREAAAIAFCDADGEYAPEELGRLVEPVLTGEADYVVGSRFAGDIQRMLPHRRFGNVVLTRLLSWVARRPIDDGQSGYRAFSPRAAAAAEVIHDFNYAQVLTLDLIGKGMRYAEVPISYRFRTTGTSFVRLGRYLRAVVPAVYRELNTA